MDLIWLFLFSGCSRNCDKYRRSCGMAKLHISLRQNENKSTGNYHSRPDCRRPCVPNKGHKQFWDFPVQKKYVSSRSLHASSVTTASLLTGELVFKYGLKEITSALLRILAIAFESLFSFQTRYITINYISILQQLGIRSFKHNT